MVKFVVFSGIIFSIGVYGLLARKHLIITLMSLELILLASTLNFIVFSIYLDDILGQIYGLLIFTIGATESAIGLALIVLYYRLRGTIMMDSYALKG